MTAIKRMILGLAIMVLGVWLQFSVIGGVFLGWITPIAGFLVVLYSFVDPRKE